MKRNEMEQILGSIRNVTVAMVGDLCLDAYWLADMKKSKLSSETPHYPLPVVNERYSLGGGGNVVANLAALNIKEVIPVSVIGDDWRGFLLGRCLEETGVCDKYIIREKGRITPCYCKPLRSGISAVIYEDPRLDFENIYPLSEESENKIIEMLDEVSKKADVIAVCDQTYNGIVTEKVRNKLCEIGKTMPVVVDSREHITLFENVIVKPNEIESAAATGYPADKPADSALALSAKNKAPAIVTWGARGSVWCKNGKTTLVPARKVEPPIDIVGAGDTFLSAFCCAYAAGVSGETALAFANTASSITVKKIDTTGTASPEEMLAAAE